MDLLRRHMFFIICGAMAAAGIALGAMGINGMPAVGDEMEKVQGIYGVLTSLKSKAVSLDRINAEARRIELLMEDRSRVAAKSEELYGYEPLVKDLFPAGDSIKQMTFRRRYAKAMEELFSSLKAGSQATRLEIDRWGDEIENEREERREIGLDPGVSAPLPPLSGPPYTPAGVLTQVGAREEAAPRAHMAAAQRIFCYAQHFGGQSSARRVESLDYDATMRDTGTADAPLIEDVWSAQVGYWIQKDVVEAIVAINNEAAAAAEKRKENAWVGIMPVKEVISIRLSDGYVPRDGAEVPGDPAGGYEAAIPPGTPETVLTHSGSNDWYEVMQFSVKLIMDQRDIPRLIDRLCKNSFHTPLRVAYRAVAPNRKMVGKIYGAEPTVNVVIDFETIMLGEVFRRLMPDEVCEYYEIRCPKREEADEE